MRWPSDGPVHLYVRLCVTLLVEIMQKRDFFNKLITAIISIVDL